LHAAGKFDTRNAALEAAGFRLLSIDNSDVDVWQIHLDVNATVTHRNAGLLAPDEIRRAARLRSLTDRRRFIVARGMLRLLLGVYADIPSEAIRFAYGSHGKPRLKPSSLLHFNVAHSGERAVYALSRTRRVGIDIEHLNREFAFERVARRFFARPEFENLLRMPEARRRRAFFALWTCKEAVIKATGKGLALGLDQFEIGLKPSPRITDAQTQSVAGIDLYAPHAGPGYVIAVAAMQPTA